MIRQHRVVAISIDPATEDGALHAVELIKQNGWRTQLFAATGDQFSIFERAVLNDPNIQAVLDFSLADFTGLQVGRFTTLQPERLTSAAQRKLPQVIVPGSVDHVIVFDDKEEYGQRLRIQQDDGGAVLRTSMDDNDHLGKAIAFRASASSAPVTIVFPCGGLSSWDREGKPTWNRACNNALLDSIALWKAPQVNLVESNRHINDPLFAQIVVDQLLKLIVVRA